MSCTPLSATHHANVFALGVQLFREEDVPEIENALATACAPSSVLVDLEGRIAGFALFCQGQSLSTKSSPQHSRYFQHLGNLKNCLELAFFAISPAYQGAGLGSKLLAHCLERLPCGATCWLVTELDNTVAPRLYAKYGFVRAHLIADARPTPLFVWIRPAKFEQPIHASNLLPPILSSTLQCEASFFTMTTFDCPQALNMCT